MCSTVCPHEHANYRCMLTPLRLLSCPAGEINLCDTKPNDEKVQSKCVIRMLEPWFWLKDRCERVYLTGQRFNVSVHQFASVIQCCSSRAQGQTLFLSSCLRLLQLSSWDTIDQWSLTSPWLMIIFENVLHWILRFKYYILDSLATFSFAFESSSLLSCYLFNLLCLEEEVEKKKANLRRYGSSCNGVAEASAGISN